MLEKQREKIELASVDDRFLLKKVAKDEQLENQEIPHLNCIRSRSPFKVKWMMMQMIETADSIKKYGVLLLRLLHLCLMAVMSW